MRSLLMSLGAVALLGSAAIADEVVVQPVPGVVIEKRGAAEGTTTSRTVHHADGCTTRSTTHTNDVNDNSVTRTQSNC